jgi:hypothetical protein
MTGPFNPLSDAIIKVYRSSADHTNPMIGILRAVPTGSKEVKGAACCLTRNPKPIYVEVTLDSSCNITCRVNNVPTENYSIKFRGKKQKRIWSSY